jgi:hypothetical protein
MNEEQGILNVEVFSSLRNSAFLVQNSIFSKILCSLFLDP